MPGRAEILLVEDSEDEVFLIRRALRRAGMNAPYVVRSGESAVAYLSGTGLYSSRQDFPQPAVVLLDLHLPGMNGFEVLKWIRDQPATRALPVLAMSGSRRPDDLSQALQLGANSFLVKEVDLADEGELVAFARTHLRAQAAQSSDAGHQEAA
jgi:CheY-like chemotaxis protein